MLATSVALAMHEADGKSPKLCDKIDEKLDCYDRGELDHAADAVTLLLSFSMRREPLTAPQNVTHEVHHSTFSPPETDFRYLQVSDFPANFTQIEMALIKSIQTGIFLNKKYWVRYSKTASTLRPIYISSIVAGEKINGRG